LFFLKGNGNTENCFLNDVLCAVKGIRILLQGNCAILKGR